MRICLSGNTGRRKRKDNECGIIHPIGIALLCSVCRDFLLQALPVVGPLPVVDVFVQGDERRMLFTDVVHDDTFELTAQIEVLQPDEVGKILNTLYDGLNIGYTGKDGRNEAYGADARLVRLAHGCQSAFDAHGTVHVAAELLVEGVDRPRNGHLREPLQQVQVAQDQIGFCADHDFSLRSPQFLKQPARVAELGFIRIVAVRHRTDDNPLAVILMRIADGLPALDVQKRSPGFSMLQACGQPTYGLTEYPPTGRDDLVMMFCTSIVLIISVVIVYV